MFTGIIEATAKVLQRTPDSLVIARPASFDDPKHGSSIAVSGVCLTVVGLTKKQMTFNVVQETWDKTKLGDLRAGDLVNVERALRADGRLDGHVVQGHVEGVGVVIELAPVGRTSIPSPLPPGEEGEKESLDIMGKKETVRKSAVPRNILLYSREMRKDPTKAEAILWKALRHDALGIRFRRQYPMGGRILDFYCPALRLGIELDGGIHSNKKVRKEDAIRDTYLTNDHGIRILRFQNEEVFQHLPKVIRSIQATVSSPPPPEEGLGVEESEGPASRIVTAKEGVTLHIQPPQTLLPFIIPKGSITLDGVSLTVASVAKNTFSVALIPETLRATTLGLLEEGNKVNMETDILGRYVQAFLRR